MNEQLKDKIYACWLGKSIGGTLGTPVEGHKEFMHLTFYPKLDEGGAVPNDDLDLQLVNLHALEQHGLDTDVRAIAAEWTEHVRFPWDEYGYASTHLRQGLLAPYAGYFDNAFTNCMGSPIRSEIWATVAAGDAKLAAYFAWQDAVVDHAGGEGVYGEMFYAALETMALFSDDKEALVEKALATIPESSRVYRAVADTLAWYRQGVAYEAIRDLILTKHGNANFTDAPQNLAFSMVGLLYGADFEDGMLKTVNLGYDTDCTVATLGSLYGLLYGTAFIPEKWSRPIGTRIVVSDAVVGLDAPADIGELTERVVRLADSLACLDASGCVISPREAVDVRRQTFTFPQGSVQKNLAVTLRYEGEATCVPGEEKAMTLEVANHSCGVWDMTLAARPCGGIESMTLTPDVLRLAPGETATVSVIARVGKPDRPEMHPQILITRLHNGHPWTEYSMRFTLLRASKWTLNGKETYVHGSFVQFAEKTEDGVYTARTAFTLPTARRTKIMCASTSPIAASLDGAEILRDGQHEDYMPAYHRAPEAQCWEGKLAAGTHTLTVTVREDFAPGFALGLLGPRNTEEPGNFYHFNDAVIG